MKHKTFTKIEEQLYSHTLENGLNIFYIPKENFSKTFAMIAANFGSADQVFKTDENQIYETPAGVAHFLEHKMFEDKDGNALQKFSKTGASPNAFTSRNITAYYFSCTDKFYENLDILTKFTCTPYFTEDNVKKECGIIEQEISMLDDDPFWNAYTNIYSAMYHNHPIKISIAGSAKSISQITPDLLYKCHKAFYSPKNLALTICGKANFEKIIEIAQKNTPKYSQNIAQRLYGERKNHVNKKEVFTQMNIAQPFFFIGIKDEPLKNEKNLLRKVIGDICCEIIAGKSSNLFNNLYEKGLISSRFNISYTIHPEAACVLINGDSKNPKEVLENVINEIKLIYKNGIQKEDFERIKNMYYGMLIRSFEQPDDLCRMQCEASFHNECFADIIEHFNKLSLTDIIQRFKILSDENRISLSVVNPKKEV